MLKKDMRYWSKELESGNYKIDKQHMQLLYQYQLLEDAIKEGHGYEKLAGLILFLHKYVITHFNTEEQYMLAHDYPDHPQHSEVHEEYKSKVIELRKYFQNNPKNPKMLTLVRSMIYLWVREHILKFDIQFLDFIKGKEKITRDINVKDSWKLEESTIWTNDLSFGHEKIDKQHQEIIKWHEILKDSQNIECEEYKKIVEFLQSFIIDHFTDEEIFMIENHYPNIDNHTNSHRDFRIRFVNFTRNQSRCSVDECKNRLQEMLDFYIQHLKEKDMLIIKWIKKNSKATNAIE